MDQKVNEILEKFWRTAHLGEVDAYVSRILPQGESFSELTGRFLDGEESVFLQIGDYVWRIVTDQAELIRKNLFPVVAAAALFSVLDRLILGRKNYISDVGFLMVYASLMSLLMGVLGQVRDMTIGGVERILFFMSAVMPAYAASMVFSGRINTAGALYSLVFAMIYTLERIYRMCLFPGIHVYILLRMLNDLYGADRFRRMADFVRDLIELFLKTSQACVLGINIIESLLAPAKDQLLVTPGIGKLTGIFGETVLGCGVLIKNSVGTALLAVMVAIAAVPLVCSLLIRLSCLLFAAVLGTFADRRLVGGVECAAKAAGLYMQVLTNSLTLFFITVAAACLGVR